MQLTVNFVGAEPNEQTPSMALYTIDARGQATKVSALSNGKVDLGADPAKLGATVALGPDVADPKTLDPKSLVTLNVAAQLPTWQKTGVIELAPNWWRPWLPVRICVSGNVHKCFPFIVDRVPVLRAIATGIRPPLEICSPVCNAVVEVWESKSCCFPFLLTDVPNLLAKLKAFLAANPVMFPTPVPRPDPIGPIANVAALRVATPVVAAADPVLAKSVDRAIAAGQIDYRFTPNTQISQDLTTLQSLKPADAVQYFQLHPSLWPIWCSSTTSKLGETTVNPDGSFSYCYSKFFLPILNCFTSYFYKVKQLQNGVWTYIYDGSAAHQYFNADEVANLSTFLGNACGTTPPPPGTDFVALQQIGGTLSNNLHSHYKGVGAGNLDLTQTGPFSVATPAATDLGGLVNFGGFNDAPWCKTLLFMLAFDPGMQALGAYYYRVTYAPADASGSPVGPMQPLLDPTTGTTQGVSWNKWVTRVVGGLTEVDVESQVLGPFNVGTATGLYTIPYNGSLSPALGTSPNQDWLGGQSHCYFDTTGLNAAATGIPGPGCGRFLLAVEIFNKTGNRMIPSPLVPAAGSGDAPASFEFLRLITDSGAGSTAIVQQPALTHLFWADNRRVFAKIDSFALNGNPSSEECQYLTGPRTAGLQVGYQAFHAVLSDPNPPHPLRTFMSGFNLAWTRGLGGGSGTLASGVDVDQPATGAAGSPVQSPAANGLLSTLLPVGGPSACSFAITLNVGSKHTNGSGSGFSDLNNSDVAALSLSVS
jgi:hypothetical protein